MNRERRQKEVAEFELQVSRFEGIAKGAQERGDYELAREALSYVRWYVATVNMLKRTLENTDDHAH